MQSNQSYAEYLRHTAVSTRVFPAASLEFFLLAQAQERRHRREMEQLAELARTFDWKLTRNYEKLLIAGNTLVISNRAKSILWVSNRFFSMTGYKPQEAIGRTPRFLQGPDTDPARLRQLSDDLAQAHLRSRPRPIRQQLINYRKGGTPYLCDIEIDPIWTKQGELTHFIAVEKEV
ncbi:PAS domain S-box-containing protein [Larkinella arboricola]|uniref:PAS domain S-box-containing protein n=1 Tax=Larkinella arboricola TaxID=643671 RepID=A0A327X3A1_LARAB|nr:PAS domain-containing protein [Larkinella arboricola]RAJ97438.1 PAS domain S-box-containing protein [Larkinella arboricola]